MSGYKAGSFIQGFLDGMETRRAWGAAQQLRDWEEEDRKIAAEDRERRIATEDQETAWLNENRDRQRTLWDREDEEHAFQTAERDAAKEAWAASQAKTQPSTSTKGTPAPVTPKPRPDGLDTGRSIRPKARPESSRKRQDDTASSSEPAPHDPHRFISADEQYYVTGHEPGGWQFPKRPVTGEEAGLQARSMNLKPGETWQGEPTAPARPAEREPAQAPQATGHDPHRFISADEQPYVRGEASGPQVRPTTEQQALTQAAERGLKPTEREPAKAGRPDPAPATKTPAQTAATPDKADDKQAAAAAADAAAAPSVQTTSATVQDATRGMDVRTATPEAIRAVGERTAQTAYDRYLKVGAPKMVEFYLSQGRVDEAREFQQFIQDEGTRKAIGSWTKAQFAAAIGDDRGFIGHMAAAYNQTGYFDDGYELVAKESGLVRDKTGKATGAKLTFRDQATGETFTQEIEDESDLYAVGIGLMAPEVRFEHYAKQVEAAQAARREIIKLERERRIDLDDQRREQVFDLVTEMVKSAIPTEEGIDIGALVAEAVKAVQTAETAMQPKPAGPNISAKP